MISSMKQRFLWSNLQSHFANFLIVQNPKNYDVSIRFYSQLSFQANTLFKIKILTKHHLFSSTLQIKAYATDKIKTHIIADLLKSLKFKLYKFPPFLDDIDDIG